MPNNRLIDLMKRFRMPLLMALVVIGSIAALVLLRNRTIQAEPTPEAVEVVVRQVNQLARPTTVAVSGEVEAQRSVDIGFKVAGVVAGVGPEEGDGVRAGQVIAQIEPTDYQLNLELASAAADAARDAFERARLIFEDNSLAPADFTKAQTAFRQATAQESLARKRVADTRLVSPISGVVARRGIDPGEQAAPGMPLFTIVALDPVQVRVGVPEAEIGRISAGQAVTVNIPSLNGSTFEGRVRLVGVAADPVSRTYTVRIAVPNPQGLLRPGMIAEVRIRDGATIQTLTLPGEAVVRNLDGVTQVFVYEPGEKRVFARRVTVGSLFDNQVEVATGLRGDELVVVGGQHRVREGMRVNAVEQPSTPVVQGEIEP